ncbi:ATP-dependent DNA helicase PIF1-like [Lasioglossum baleicum]|uniref:ATP-dependent DNA helicase PIF1-like n=1 Tax=Lasioglossum baleicum TaxID=434251 RepID=UPI003FCD1041
MNADDNEPIVNDEDGPDNALQFSPQDDGLADLQLVNAPRPVSDVDAMVNALNPDQLRVFENVKAALSEGRIIHQFVSGTGGTGKSFLISTIPEWVAKNLSKSVAVSAPTGVAAYNINGLTIFKLLQLPVEHGSIPPFAHLPDITLQRFREELKNTVLFIIDEISMVSNLMFMYIHLRLTEIYGTDGDANGWFGKRSILLFGDLLQLPPVHEDPVYVKLSPKAMDKYVGGMCSINIWQELFRYDELTINMRQRSDATFAAALDRARVGALTPNDIDLFNSRKMNLVPNNISANLLVVAQAFSTSPVDTVCILPTRHMCSVLNQAMLDRLPTPVISLKAIDSIDCSKYLRKRVETLLKKTDDDSTATAGLEQEIVIKLGAKVMLRRNIDVTIGLVNGAIGTLQGVTWDVNDKTQAKSLQIAFASGIHSLEPVKAKFQILPKAFVHRKQFSITLAYAFTIHKSQGLSLSNVIVDLGEHVFAPGQAYVALSRVTSLNGLQLINLDPNSIKASPSALTEINRLRYRFRPDLKPYPTVITRFKRSLDRPWTAMPGIDEIQDDTSQPVKEAPIRVYTWYETSLRG